MQINLIVNDVAEEIYQAETKKQNLAQNAECPSLDCSAAPALKLKCPEKAQDCVKVCNEKR